MKCSCGRKIEQERIDLLGSDKCSECAKRCNTSKVRGIMVWHHKTAPSMQVVSEDTHSQYKKDTYRRGAGSILRYKSPNNGAPI